MENASKNAPTWQRVMDSFVRSGLPEFDRLISDVVPDGVVVLVVGDIGSSNEALVQRLVSGDSGVRVDFEPVDVKEAIRKMYRDIESQCLFGVVVAKQSEMLVRHDADVVIEVRWTKDGIEAQVPKNRYGSIRGWTLLPSLTQTSIAPAE